MEAILSYVSELFSPLKTGEVKTILLTIIGYSKLLLIHLKSKDNAILQNVPNLSPFLFYSEHLVWFLLFKLMNEDFTLLLYTFSPTH